MAEDVGHAHLKSIDEVLGFAPGQLSGEFANGGVSEIDNTQNGEVLSMEDFLKAEENLEHAPSSMHEIEEAAVTATTHLEQKLEQTTFLYSQKETGREQNGGAADDNTVTEIGRLKVGIQDDADRRIKEEKRNQYRVLELAIQQAHDMEHLQAEMAKLLEENQKLKDEIADLEKDLDIAEELMANIDDLNSDNPNTRKAARQKASVLLAKNDIDLSKFENKDGLIDTEATKEALKHQHSEDEEQKNQKDTELAKNEEKIKDVRSKIDNRKIETAKQSNYIGNNDDNNPEVSAFDVDNAFDNTEDSAFDNVTDNAFDTAFDDIDLYGSNIEQSAIEINKTTQLEEFDTSKTTGSFSGSGEETTSVISAQFTAKADINQPAAEVNPDLQQNNQITPPAAINGLG